MAWGKPVVHFSLPTLDWMDGDVAVDTYDTGALAEAIRSLAADADLRAKLGSKAREVAELLSVDRTAERYLDLARELLAE
jgi:glycosyltransferase involved in cell wall biosynthesis